MSARSMARARRRSNERRGRRLARNTAIGAVAVLGTVAAPEVASAAPFTVTTTLDSGAGSLRDALTMANSTPEADTISFAPAVTGTITLSSPLVAARSTTIDGPGENVLTLRAPSTVVLFLNDMSVDASSVLEIEGLTLEGHSSGAGSCGGGVVAGGSSGGLTIRNTTISGSTSSNEGGAICSKETSVSLIDSTLAGNVAGGDGGAIYSRGASVREVGSTLTGNKTSGDGGAIEIRESAGPKQASLTSVGSRITNNQATGQGGGIDLSSADGPTSIQSSTISGNTASDDGGGLYFGDGAALAIDASTFDHNSSATDGGGLYIYAPDGPVTISDSTVAKNVGSIRGGGIFSTNYYDTPFSVIGSTIASNSGAGTGGGIFRVGYDASGPNYAGPDNISLTNTIVAQNFDNTGPELAQGPLASGSFQTAFSLIGSTAGGAAITETTPGSNILDATGPFVTPLADNGGPTQTMLPAVDGRAVDAGTAAELSADQRGLARSVDQPLIVNASDGTDIGAVELADTDLSGAQVSAKKKQKEKGKKIVIAVNAGASENVTATAGGTVKVGKKKVALTVPATTVAAGQSATLKLKPSSKKGAKKIAKRLSSGKKAKATINVTLTDAAANSEDHAVKVKLSEKGKQPH